MPIGSGLENLPWDDDMYLDRKKSNPVSASRSLPVLRDLLPKSYKHPPNPVAVLEITGAKPRCRTAVGSRWPGCEFSATDDGGKDAKLAAKKKTGAVSSLAA